MRFTIFFLLTLSASSYTMPTENPDKNQHTKNEDSLHRDEDQHSKERFHPYEKSPNWQKSHDEISLNFELVTTSYHSKRKQSTQKEAPLPTQNELENQRHLEKLFSLLQLNNDQKKGIINTLKQQPDRILNIFYERLTNAKILEIKEIPRDIQHLPKTLQKVSRNNEFHSATVYILNCAKILSLDPHQYLQYLKPIPRPQKYNSKLYRHLKKRASKHSLGTSI
jgi:hypothetical protein